MAYLSFTFEEQLRYYPKSLKDLRAYNPFNQKVHYTLARIAQYNEYQAEKLINGCYYLCVSFCHDRAPLSDPYQYVIECSRFGDKYYCISIIQIMLREYANQCAKKNIDPLQPIDTINEFCDKIEDYREADLATWDERINTRLSKAASETDLSEAFRVHPTPPKELTGYDKAELARLTNDFDIDIVKRLICYYREWEDQLQLLDIFKSASDNYIPF